MQAVPDLLEQEAAEWDPDMRGLLAELAECEGGLPQLVTESSPSAELGSQRLPPGVHSRCAGPDAQICCTHLHAL